MGLGQLHWIKACRYIYTKKVLYSHPGWGCLASRRLKSANGLISASFVFYWLCRGYTLYMKWLIPIDDDMYKVYVLTVLLVLLFIKKTRDGNYIVGNLAVCWGWLCCAMKKRWEGGRGGGCLCTLGCEAKHKASDTYATWRQTKCMLGQADLLALPTYMHYIGLILFTQIRCRNIIYI